MSEGCNHDYYLVCNREVRDKGREGIFFMEVVMFCKWCGNVKVTVSQPLMLDVGGFSKDYVKPDVLGVASPGLLAGVGKAKLKLYIVIVMFGVYLLFSIGLVLSLMSS